MLQYPVKNLSNKTILAIETSCDETSAAIIQGTEVLSNVVYSQIDLHKEYGGVVPSIARTAHQEKLPEVVEKTLAEAGLELVDVEAVAVTQGPGLAIALEVGINYAKDIATKLDIPLIPINHMEGHLVSVLAGLGVKHIEFPILGLLVSGGHTEFVLVHGIGEYEKVGQTLDDACGEAFDKAAVMLGLGYPGGPAVSKAAAAGRHHLDFQMERDQQTTYVRAYETSTSKAQPKYELPIPMLNSGDLNMSYSGLKTAVKQLVNNLSGNSDNRNIRETGESEALTKEQVEEVSAVFEEAATEQITRKLKSALKKYPEVTEVWMGGGVVANRVLVAKISNLLGEQDVTLRIPKERLLTADNAGMIGIAAAFKLADSQKALDPTRFGEVDRDPGMSL